MRAFLSIGLCLALATLAAAGPPDYATGYAESLRTGKQLLVYVGVPSSPAADGSIVCEAPTLTGYAKGDVVRAWAAAGQLWTYGACPGSSCSGPATCAAGGQCAACPACAAARIDPTARTPSATSQFVGVAAGYGSACSSGQCGASAPPAVARRGLFRR